MHWGGNSLESRVCLASDSFINPGQRMVSGSGACSVSASVIGRSLATPLPAHKAATATVVSPLSLFVEG